MSAIIEPFSRIPIKHSRTLPLIFLVMSAMVSGCRAEEVSKQDSLGRPSKEAEGEHSGNNVSMALTDRPDDSPSDDHARKLGAEISQLTDTRDFLRQLQRSMKDKVAEFTRIREAIVNVSKKQAIAAGYSGQYSLWDHLSQDQRAAIRRCIMGMPGMIFGAQNNPFSSEPVTKIAPDRDSMMNAIKTISEEARQWSPSHPCFQYASLVEKVGSSEFLRKLYSDLAYDIYVRIGEIAKIEQELTTEITSYEEELAAFRANQSTFGSYGNADFNPFRNMKDANRPLDYIVSNDNPLVRSLSDALQATLASSASSQAGTGLKRSAANVSAIYDHFAKTIPERADKKVRDGKFSNRWSAMGYSVLMMFTPWRLAKGLTGGIHVLDPDTGEISPVDGSALVLDAAVFASLGKFSFVMALQSGDALLTKALQSGGVQAAEQASIQASQQTIRQLLQRMPAQLKEQSQKITSALRAGADAVLVKNIIRSGSSETFQEIQEELIEMAVVDPDGAGIEIRKRKEGVFKRIEEINKVPKNGK